MNEREFNKYLARDGGCVHCGDAITAVPHHRLNRGMGGSKERDRPSNIVALCAIVNGLVESDARWYEAAMLNGWKLRSGQEPSVSPIYYAYDGKWFMLDDKMNKVETSAPVRD